MHCQHILLSILSTAYTLKESKNCTSDTGDVYKTVPLTKVMCIKPYLWQRWCV